MKPTLLAAVLAFFLQSSDEVAWTSVGRVNGLTGTWAPHYTPVVLLGGSQIRVYSSSDRNGNVIGDLFLYEGTWSKVGAPSMVLSRAVVQAVDGIGDETLRTGGVARGVSGTYYSLQHPCIGTNQCRPAWATSADGVTWTYYGHILIDGQPPNINSDSDALVVREEKPAVLDPVTPANNRFLGWENEVYVEEDGQTVLKNFVLIYSSDGFDWRYARDVNGRVIDLWPRSQYPWWPIYQTAARTPYGYHVAFAAPTYPATAIMHIFSCDGATYRIVEEASELFAPHGEAHHAPNFAYESVTGLLHALVGGQHWQTQAQALACP